MELYYHVVHFNRGKKCKFSFCFSGDLKDYIIGNAVVNLNTTLRKAEFDEKSDTRLKEAEKKYIVKNVLKHIS